MLKRSAHTLIAIGTTLAASLLALGATPAQAAAPTASPQVGECHAMTLKRAGAYADPSAPIPCSKRHTSVTFGVAEVSTPLVGLSEQAVVSMAEDACVALQIELLGRNVTRRATSAYALLFFQPTRAQLQAGAQWFRCDLALFAGRKLLPMPAHLHRPVLTKHRSDSTERCLTSERFATPCSAKHSYRPVDVIRFRPGAYPTKAGFRHAGTRYCPDRGTYYTWSVSSEWKAGDRYLVCYTRTTR
jgi:hypothetical protein